MNFGLCEHSVSQIWAQTCFCLFLLCILHLHTLCHDAFLPSLLKAWANTAATTTAAGAQREIWVASCSWTVEVLEGFGKPRWLQWCVWVPEALSCVLRGDSTLSTSAGRSGATQEHQDRLSRGVNVWATLLTGWQLKAEANAEDFLLPALHLHCWLCKHVRLGIQKHWAV